MVPHNVAEACTPPKLVRKELKPLDAEQAKRLLTVARETQPKLCALYVLAVTTGMRQGELLGLKWEDVDLDTGTLQVRRRSVFNGQVNAPKTNSKRRTVKLSQVALEALIKHSEHGIGTWVFPTKNGTAAGSWNFVHKRTVHRQGS